MDIFTTLCDSLIALIVSYRQFYPDWPLLPWLHSTEPVEHVFGVLRQLKMDFNFADFLNFISKLCAFLLGSFGSMSAENRGNATASGYWHTYANADGIDLKALVSWPTDAEITAMSDLAFQDVVRILKVVGIDADSMLSDVPSPPKSRRKPKPKPAPPARTQPSRAAFSLMRLPQDVRDSYLIKDRVDSLSELMRTHAKVPVSDADLKEKLDVTAAAAADMQESDAM